MLNIYLSGVFGECNIGTPSLFHPISTGLICSSNNGSFHEWCSGVIHGENVVLLHVSTDVGNISTCLSMVKLPMAKIVVTVIDSIIPVDAP